MRHRRRRARYHIEVQRIRYLSKYMLCKSYEPTLLLSICSQLYYFDRLGCQLLPKNLLYPANRPTLSRIQMHACLRAWTHVDKPSTLSGNQVSGHKRVVRRISWIRLARWNWEPLIVNLSHASSVLFMTRRSVCACRMRSFGCWLNLSLPDR